MMDALLIAIREEKMDRELKQIIFVGLTVIFGATNIWGFMIGAGTATGRSCHIDDYSCSKSQDVDREKGCSYDVIAKIINPGYIAGCELFRPRRWGK